VPLTGTNVVKFRQYVKDVPVYGSLVSVELGDRNETISLNSNLATPDIKASTAKVAPQEILKTVAERAGLGRSMPSSRPILNYYLDAKASGILLTLSRNVRIQSAPKQGTVAQWSAGLATPRLRLCRRCDFGCGIAELARFRSVPPARGR
jgi:Zn-dependent metalloprotease